MGVYARTSRRTADRRRTAVTYGCRRTGVRRDAPSEGTRHDRQEWAGDARCGRPCPLLMITGRTDHISCPNGELAPQEGELARGGGNRPESPDQVVDRAGGEPVPIDLRHRRGRRLIHSPTSIRQGGRKDPVRSVGSDNASPPPAWTACELGNRCAGPRALGCVPRAMRRSRPATRLRSGPGTASRPPPRHVRRSRVRPGRPAGGMVHGDRASCASVRALRPFSPTATRWPSPSSPHAEGPGRTPGDVADVRSPRVPRSRPTHSRPDCRAPKARLAHIKASTYSHPQPDSRTRTADSSCRNGRLIVPERSTHRAGTVDPPCWNGRFAEPDRQAHCFRSVNSPCPIGQLAVSDRSTRPGGQTLSR